LTSTERSLDQLAARTDAEAVVPVENHQDIVDQRRKALCTMGYDVRFRWQIASDRYSIINPQEAYQPIITALQRRGETGAFGWLSYRDWGGLLKLCRSTTGRSKTRSNGSSQRASRR
jgi:hypothetical protein